MPPKKDAGPAPTYAIKILHERKSGAARKVRGYSGMNYCFLWNAEHKAYIFRPESLAQSDDIFKTQGRIYTTVFAPVSIEPEPAAAPTPTMTPATIEACILRGLIVAEGDSEETAQRLIRAHDTAFAAGAERAKASAPPAPIPPPKPQKAAKPAAAIEPAQA